MLPRWLPLSAVVLSLLLAGCTVGGNDGTPSTAPAARPTSTLGSIAGLVTDEEARPVSGVDIAVVETKKTLRTDAQGIFVINNLTGGAYQLVFQRSGYGSVARTVQVSAGDISQIVVPLFSIGPRTQPLIDYMERNGYIECSINPFYAINLCQGVVGPDESRFFLQIDSNLSWRELVAEVIWEPGTALTAQQMEVSVCEASPAGPQGQAICSQGAADDPTAGQETYWRHKSSAPPVIMRLMDLPVDQTTHFEIGVGASWASDSPNPVFQQSFTLHQSLCYNRACPPGYTALPPE